MHLVSVSVGLSSGHPAGAIHILKNMAHKFHRLTGKSIISLRGSRILLFFGCARNGNGESANMPRGFLPIYVGEECRRYVVEAHYLNHPLLAQLLEFSAAELGYSQKGGLRIACDIQLFEHLLDLLATSNPSAHYLQIHDLLQKFSA